MHWYADVLRKYAVFEGRAARTEYWMFVLFNFIIGFVLGFLESFLNISPALSWLYMIAVFVPSVAVGVRRLHDTDKSGWWLLLALIPILGALVLLYFMVQDSTDGANRFGANPKGVASSADTSVYQSEPEIKETEKVTDEVVIKDVPASEPIAPVPNADMPASSPDSSSSSDSSTA
jgi:uncharacterized membrane protein YhaH (DUF805 family)